MFLTIKTEEILRSDLRSVIRSNKSRLKKNQLAALLIDRILGTKNKTKTLEIKICRTINLMQKCGLKNYEANLGDSNYEMIARFHSNKMRFNSQCRDLFNDQIVDYILTRNSLLRTTQFEEPTIKSIKFFCIEVQFYLKNEISKVDQDFITNRLYDTDNNIEHIEFKKINQL